jgi:hypothetical protein
MRRHAMTLTLVPFVLAIGIPAAWSQMPETLSFQGRLTDNTGNPVNGPVNLTFRLYDAENGGTEIWSETKPGVNVSSGIYGVLLGAAGWGTADFSAPYWLSVQVGTDAEMAPRYTLASSPYAMRAKKAGDAGQLDGKAASVYLDLAQHTGTLPLAKGGTGTTSFAAGSVVFSNGMALAEDNANLFWDDTSNRLGIGTTTPGATLDVRGGVNVTGNASIAGTLTGATWNGGTIGVAYGGTGLTASGASGNYLRCNNSIWTSSPILVSDLPAHAHDASYWKLTGNGGTTAGTNFLGTTDNVALEMKVNGARVLRLEPHTTSPNIVGGHVENNVTSGVYGATISGGGAAGVGSLNAVTDNYGTVGGGINNRAGDNGGTVSDRPYATVGGGVQNTASGYGSAVSGGFGNSAGGSYSTVGGGTANYAFGFGATVAGGRMNTAYGDYSFSSGRRAVNVADHDGVFLFADSNDLNFASIKSNEFAVRATGGVRFVTAIDGSGNPTKKLSIGASGDVATDGGVSAASLNIGGAGNFGGNISVGSSLSVSGGLTVGGSSLLGETNLNGHVIKNPALGLSLHHASFQGAYKSSPVNVYDGLVELKTTTTANTYSYIQGPGNGVVGNLNSDGAFLSARICPIYINATYKYYIVAGDFNWGFGFKIEGSALKGIIFDSGETTYDLGTTVGGGGQYRILAVHRPSNNIEFFVNGVSKGLHPGQPQPSANYIYECRAYNGSAGGEAKIYIGFLTVGLPMF